MVLDELHQWYQVSWQTDLLRVKSVFLTKAWHQMNEYMSRDSSLLWSCTRLLALVFLHDLQTVNPVTMRDFAGINKHEKSHLFLLFLSQSCLNCRQPLKSSVVLTEDGCRQKRQSKAIDTWFQTWGRGRLKMCLLSSRRKEPAALMDWAIVRLQINSYFPSSEIGSEESNWRAEIMQSKVSEGSDSSFLPINCSHCLTQLVVMVQRASHSIL